MARGSAVKIKQGGRDDIIVQDPAQISMFNLPCRTRLLQATIVTLLAADLVSDHFNSRHLHITLHSTLCAIRA